MASYFKMFISTCAGYSDIWFKNEIVSKRIK